MNRSQAAKLTLRAVPPVALPQTPAPAPPSSEPLSPNVSARSPHRKRWLIGVTAGSIALLGAIPFPDSIRGDGEISSTSGNRQTITIASAGWVKTTAKVGDRVQPGQVLANVTSEDLQQSFVQATSQNQQAQTQVAIAQQSLLPLMAEVNEARTRVATSQQKTAWLQSQLEQLDQGSLPQIRQNASEQAGLTSQITGLQSQLAIVSDRVQRYERIKDAIPHNEIEAQRSQQISLTAQIQELQHRVEAKATTTETLRTELQQQLLQQQAEMGQAIAALNTKQETINQTQAGIATHQVTAQQRTGELSRQQQRQQQDSALQAKVSGTVVKANLDPQTQQYLAAGSPVLEIVDLSQLVATIQIRPEDRVLLRVGDQARICPRSTLLCYDGSVKDVEPISRLNDQKTAASVAVRIQIVTNPGDVLHPGLHADASVEVRSTSFYEKLQREIAKLVSPRRFV